MLNILAESDISNSTVPLTWVAAIGSTVVGLGSIVVAFLWHQHLKNLKRLEKLEASYQGLTGFVSAVMGMTLNGDTLKSSTVRDLFDRFQPNDGSGVRQSLKVPAK